MKQAKRSLSDVNAKTKNSEAGLCTDPLNGRKGITQGILASQKKKFGVSLFLAK
jgi:hypothetical protein